MGFGILIRRRPRRVPSPFDSWEGVAGINNSMLAVDSPHRLGSAPRRTVRRLFKTARRLERADGRRHFATFGLPAWPGGAGARLPRESVRSVTVTEANVWLVWIHGSASGEDMLIHPFPLALPRRA